MTEDYNAEDSDAEEAPASPPQTPEPTHEEQVESQIDPSMAEWFDVGAKAKARATLASDSGSETEPEPDEQFDSENEDMKPEPEVGFEEGEDWEQIEKEDTQNQKVSQEVNHATSLQSEELPS